MAEPVKPINEHTKAILERLPQNTPTVGAEIGVFRGENAVELLRQRHLLRIHLIDPWKPANQIYKENEYRPEAFEKPSEWWDAVFVQVREAVAVYAQRVAIIRLPSILAARTVPDGFLDWCFLDPNHSERAVTEDTQMWLPKVKAGGWIGGHDYNHPRNESGLYGVNKAVDRWVHQEGKKLEIGAGYTWFVRV